MNLKLRMCSNPCGRAVAAIATCLVLTACPDDGIVNPFASGDTGSSSSGGADDGDDDGQTSGMTMTTQPGTGDSTGDGTSTGMVDPTLDGTSSSGGRSDESSTGTPGDASSSDGGSTDGSSSSDGGGMVTPCPVDTIDLVPFSYSDSISGEADEFGGSCGGGGAPDHAYTLVAPGDGFYVFDTFGSTFDTVLYVLDGECGGAQLACNDDEGFGTQSEVSVALSAGQTVTVVVDSFGLAGGNYTLSGTFFGGTCPDGDIGNQVPQTTMGDTSDGDNTTSGTCGGGIAFDDSYTFTAPADGVYVFDTEGSSFDTVLYAFSGDCNGAEIACNDDLSGMSSDSRIYADLSAGEQIVLVVDGAAAESGAWTLNVGQHACPAEDLGTTAPQTTGGTTTGLPNVLSGSCGGGSAPEIGLLFEAPVDGTYVIDTFGSGFDTLLYVLDGPGCAGTQLGCNDDTVGLQSQVVIDLAAGQQVSIMVDGFGAGSSGNYTLNIGVIAGTCPDADLGSTVPQTVNGDTSLGDNAGGGTCGGLGGNDENWTFTAPNDGVFIFDTIGSGTDTILYVLDGDCNGASLGCNDDAVGSASVLNVPMTMGQEVVVVVDGDGVGGPYTLNVSEDVCPDQDIGNMSPFTTMGTTAGASNTLSSTCGGGGAPDVALVWEAPAAGAYTIDTFGSAYDTMLYVLDGATCGGAQLACNDDTVGLQSQVNVNLAAGQQVVIVVDGFGGASGNYVLNIN